MTPKIKANLLKFTDWFEHNNRYFDQKDFTTCVAAHMRAYQEDVKDSVHIDGHESSVRSMGLGGKQVHRICYPSTFGALPSLRIDGYKWMNKSKVAAALRRLAETGVYEFTPEEVNTPA